MVYKSKFSLSLTKSAFHYLGHYAIARHIMIIFLVEWIFFLTFCCFELSFCG